MKISERSTEKELIDLGPSHYTKKEYEDCLLQLARVGRLLGGNRATLQTLCKLPKPDSILDVGCGGGQFAIQLANYFPQTEVVGIDISEEAIDIANKNLTKSTFKNVKFEVANGISLPFPSNSFDIVTSTLVCHHLNDTQLIDFLKNSYRVASKTVIINDLHRHWLATASFTPIAKLFFRNRLIVHDGLLSIRRSFTREDWIHYLLAAGIPLERCSITWHWAFRWMLIIDTTSNSES